MAMLTRLHNARTVLKVVMLAVSLFCVAAQDDVMTADGLNLTDYDAERVGLCGTGMTTDENNTACVCVEGYGFANGACSECGVGTYKDFAGNASCSACPADSTSLMGSASATECLCAAGFAFNGTQCVACGVGSYKAYAGNDACLECEALRTTDGVGSAAVSACVCVPGYQDIAGVCQACGVGTHDDGSGVCVNCAQGETTEHTASTSAADCVCDVGYGLVDGVCVECGSGTIKTFVGSSACEAVPTHAVHALDGSGLYTLWECAPGYTLQEGACVPCAANTFKPTRGNSTCTACWANSHSDVTQPVPDQWVLAADSQLCSDACGALGLLCDGNAQSLRTDAGVTAAFAQVGVDCSTHIIQYGSFAGVPFEHDATHIGCYGVSAGFTSTCDVPHLYPGNRALCRCVADSAHFVGSQHCACDAGYYASAFGVCSACTADFYCVGGSSYQQTGDHGERTACPGNSTAPAGVSSEEECVCAGGFEKIE